VAEPGRGRHATDSLALGNPAMAGPGHSAGSWVALSLIWSAAVAVLPAPLALALYRRSS
jgi:hypothetical protein